MGTATSKTPKNASPISRFTSSKARASKRILKQNSSVYPSTVPCSTNSGIIEHNNNSPESLPNVANDGAVVALRKKEGARVSDESLSPSTPRSSKKENKKKKKSDVAVNGDDNVSTYHKTNVCYYKVENGKFLKLPSDTKHKSNDGCYVKLSNGSFRHLMVPDGAGSRQELNIKPKDLRHSMPVQKIIDKERERNEERQTHHKVMVTMIDGGLPVVAVSKRNRTTNASKKEKKVKRVGEEISGAKRSSVTHCGTPSTTTKCRNGCVNVWMIEMICYRTVCDLAFAPSSSIISNVFSLS
jgi:hypothetical protein